ncbi:hypothetical protein MRY87_01240 [bacterium]|nr:hypothetical protein [bacterium]
MARVPSALSPARASEQSALHTIRQMTKDIPGLQRSPSPVEAIGAPRDAAVVNIGNGAHRGRELEVYGKGGAIPSAPVEKPESPPLFRPGGQITGKYDDTSLHTSSGKEGSYFALPGGKLGFELDGFHGIITGNDAVAFNRETGESFSLTVKYGNGSFSMGEMKELKETPFNPGKAQPLFTEGTQKDIKIERTNESEFAVSLLHPTTGEPLEGRGYLNPDGSFSLQFSNGARLSGNYAFGEDGELLIFGED